MRGHAQLCVTQCVTRSRRAPTQASVQAHAAHTCVQGPLPGALLSGLTGCAGRGHNNAPRSESRQAHTNAGNTATLLAGPTCRHAARAPGAPPQHSLGALNCLYCSLKMPYLLYTHLQHRRVGLHPLCHRTTRHAHHIQLPPPSHRQLQGGGGPARARAPCHGGRGWAGGGGCGGRGDDGHRIGRLVVLAPGCVWRAGGHALGSLHAGAGGACTRAHQPRACCAYIIRGGCSCAPPAARPPTRRLGPLTLWAPGTARRQGAGGWLRRAWWRSSRAACGCPSRPEGTTQVTGPAWCWAGAAGAAGRCRCCEHVGGCV